MRVRYTAPASRDLAALLGYAETHWPQNLRRLTDRIRHAEGLLSRFPKAGPMTERRTVRRLNLKPFPYVIFYRVTASEIEVLRIHHTAQEPSDPPDA